MLKRLMFPPSLRFMTAWWLRFNGYRSWGINLPAVDGSLGRVPDVIPAFRERNQISEAHL